MATNYARTPSGDGIFFEPNTPPLTSPPKPAPVAEAPATLWSGAISSADQFINRTLPTGIIDSTRDRWSVTQSGAVAGSTADQTGAIQTAINSGKIAHVLPGTYEVAGTLIINANQALELSPGATLLRTTGDSTNPLVWLRGSGASLTGAGLKSRIVSQKASPLGVVRVGYKDMTQFDPVSTIQYCNVRHLSIEGRTQYGQPSGDKDTALYLCNPQTQSDIYSSYFHLIDDVTLSNVNYGLHLHGWANGNRMTQIAGANIGDGLIYFHGGIDNILLGTFLDHSPNAAVAIFQDEELNGQLYQSCYNLCILHGEPGGDGATTLKEIVPSTGYGNTIVSVCATNTGFTLVPGYFERRNTIIQGTAMKTYDLDAHGISRLLTLWHGDRVRVRSDFVPNFFDMPANEAVVFEREKHWQTTGLVEGKRYKVMSIDIPNDKIACGNITIEGALAGGNGVQNSGIHGRFLVEKRIVGETPPVIDLESVAEHKVTTQVTHFEDHDVIDFMVTVPNNGTGLSTISYLTARTNGFNLADQAYHNYLTAGVEVP